MTILRNLAAALMVATAATSAAAEEINVVSWNVENWGTSDSGTIASQLRDDFDKIDIFGLAEVYNDAFFAIFADYVGRGEAGPYKVVAGTTGRDLHLGVLYRADKFDVVDSFELTDLQFGQGRAPLIVKFKSRADSQEFYFIVNHLHRGDDSKRLKQAIGLSLWAANQTIPVIATGDYNFDVEVATQVGNVSYDAFLANGAFRWIVPSNLITTNWSDEDPKDGQNDYNSILDFIFLSGSTWSAAAKILVRPNDFPDNDYKSDHRPVVAVVSTTGGVVVGVPDDLTPLRTAQRDPAVFDAPPRAAESGVEPARQNVQVLNSAGQTQIIIGDDLGGLRQEIEQLREDIRLLQNTRN